jgi:hypothetical protein
MMVAALPVAKADVLDENNVQRADPERFATSGYEFGEEIVLSGVPTGIFAVTNFAYEYFGYGPAFTSNSVTMALRFYSNNATNGTPGSLLFDSGYFPVPATPAAGSVVSFAGLNVSVPRGFTWAVEFQGLGAGGGGGLQSAGLDLYGVPTVGFTYDDYWERSGAGGTWVLRTPSPGNPPINFGCVVLGTYSGPPVVTRQPTNVVAGVGQQAVFTVVASGTPTLTYQWAKAGNPILNATNASLVLTNLAYTDSGSYAVAISNNDGATNSLPATLLVNNAPAIPAKGGATSQNTPLVMSVAKLLQGVTDTEGDSFALAGSAATSAQGGIITSNAGTFVYTPASGFTGTDSFDYYVRDNRGAIGVGTVQVLVVSGALPGQNTVVIQLVSNGVLVRFAGIPGRSYQVQRTTDLVTWNTAQVLTAAPYGIIDYVDTAPPPGFAAYRTLAVP